MMGYFSEQDARLIERLQFDPNLEPSYDFVKNCLVWDDERPNGLTPDGYEKLCDLWIARSFIHRGVDFNTWSLDPEYFGHVWQEAYENNRINWPGFNRIEISDEDRRFMEEKQKEAENDESI